MKTLAISAVVLVLVVLAAMFFVFEPSSQPAIIEWCRGCV
jgi:hypothetical protein